ncbi:MAG: DNA-directed RNA polymerase subunit B [Candidatus Aenigmatarchaeota archaeon]
MSFESLIELYERDKGWVKFQIDSFNRFIDQGMQEIIDEIGTIKMNPEVGDLKLKFGKVSVGKPIIKEADGSTRQIYPNEARIRNLTYAAPVYVEITPIINGIQEKPETVHIGNMPVMVRSNICSTFGLSEQELIERGEDPNDPGGYFIVNGTERVLVLIEEIASNKAIFEKEKDTVSVRISSERSGFRQRHVIERRPDGEITISFANLRRLPIVILMKSLGLETDKEICFAISNEPRILNELYINLYQTDVATKDEAIKVLGKKLKVSEDYKEERVAQILDRYLLPHIGQEPKNRIEKAKFLAKVVRKTIMLGINMIPEDDIDHYGNKRLLMSGELLGQLFRSILLGRWGMLAKMNYNYQKLVKRGKHSSIQGIIEANAVTKQILSSLATGNWIGGRTGVSQRLDRSSYVKTISHLRSVISPLTSTQEHFKARQIHPTEWGRICPAETPEGSAIGLRKHLALMAEITPGLDVNENEMIMKSVMDLKPEIVKTQKPKDETPHSAKADVYFNGSFIMETRNAPELVESIKRKRRMNLISNQVNVSYYPQLQEVRINTTHGRVRRPLIIVENGKPKITEQILEKIKEGKIDWNYLIQHGIVEYLDAEEEENSYIALWKDEITKDHTHVEIDPISMAGLSANLIPYPEYNRGDRINYGAKMVGQSIGLMCNNFPLRVDTKFNVLAYPQSPLITTKASRIMEIYPEGQNIVIAIMCYDGYNMNDAIVMNKSSVERGMFRSFYFRTYETLKKKYWGGQEDEIAIPDPAIKGFRGDSAYKDIGEDGIINPETPVESDSVLIGKISPLRFLSGEEFVSDIENKRETSITVRHGERGVVDKVIISETTDANQLFKVVIRDNRIPELGDKFASRHGQKGVISLLVPHEDMPFTSSGIVPDIVFNPHAIPSRMTVGQLLEMLAGKMASQSGRKIDASAFRHMKEGEIRKAMRKMGFRDDGKETLYDGRTGRKYEALIFTGISYYMKLDHMVANKIHARSRGPVTLLTKQPTEGRAKRGGLRIGEMEQQCLVGHGAALALKERFDSDTTKIPICRKCGLVAIHDFVKNKTYCGICKESEIVWVETSYAFKLTADEMKSMIIYPKIVTEEV